MNHRPLPFLIAAASMLLPLPARAVIKTWDGGGADNNIGTASNWLDDIAPVSDLANTDLVFAGGVRLSPNFAATFSAKSITFDSTAGAFTISGQSITIGSGGIVNNDTQTQTFGNAITLGATTSTFNAASGALTFGNLVTVGTGTTLTLDGANAFSFGNINGSGTLNKTGGGTMTWAPTISTTPLDMIIAAGTVNTSADGSTDGFNSSGSIAINNTAALNLGESFTATGGTLSRAVGATLTIAAGKTLTAQSGGDITITGAFNTTSAANFVVTGSGSTFTTTFGMGLSNGSNFAVSAGGTLSAGGNPITIGSGSNGTVTVDGAGSSMSGATLTLGSAGATGSLTFSNAATGTFTSLFVDNSATAGTNGNLTIQSGAIVSASLLLVAPSSVANTGVVTITGSGSALIMSGASASTIGAGSSSTGTINVQSAGTFQSNTGTLTVGATGTVNITGGTYQSNGNLTVNGTVNRDAGGAFTLAAGRTLAMQSGGDFLVSGGVQEFATASTVAVTGAGSTLVASGVGAELAFRGGSLLNVLTGGQVTSPILRLASGSGNATVTVDGSGSAVNAVNGVFGNGAAAFMTVSNGASAAFSGYLSLGDSATSGTGGSVVVQSGSSLTTNALSVASVNGPASGTLSVHGSGSVVSLGSGASVVGASLSGSAMVNVESGAVLNTGTGLFSVLNTGSLGVSGGTVNFQGNAVFDSSELSLIGLGSEINVASNKTVTFQNGGDLVLTSTGLLHDGGGGLLFTGAGSSFTGSGGSGITVTGFSEVYLFDGATASGAQYFDVLEGTLYVDGSSSSLSVTTGATLWGGPGTSAQVTFSNGASGSLPGLSLGQGTGAYALVKVESGSDLTLGHLAIADPLLFSTAYVFVEGAGSTVTQTGASTLSIGGNTSGGALVLLDNGEFTTGIGTTTVMGGGDILIQGGTFHANGDILLNGGGLTRSGLGTLDIAAGKTMTVSSGGSVAITGSYQTAGSHIAIVGPASRMDIDDSLGISGASVVSVQSGGDLMAFGRIDIGNGTDGTLMVDGTGHAYSNVNSQWGAAGGTATVTLSNNATANFSHLTLASSGGDATVQINSGSEIGHGGNLLLATGNQAGSDASVTIDGSGSTWEQSGAVGVTIGSANQGTASLILSNGGSFATGTATSQIQATGALNVGSGSIFTANGSLAVNGGQVTTSSGSTFTQAAGILAVLNGGDVVFGSTPSLQSSAGVTVSGVGSTLSSSGAALAFNGIPLTVTAGGSVTSGQSLNIGVVNSSTVTVDGAGSSLSGSNFYTHYWGAGGGAPVITYSNNASGSFGLVYLGLNGNTTNATLNIASGADVTMAGISAADTTNTTQAQINVGGTGSSLTITDFDLVLGSNSGSTATLNINSGGLVQLHSYGGLNNLILNPTGTVNLNGGSLVLGDAIARNGGALNFFSGGLSLGENLVFGAGGLLGTNFTLDSSRQLTVAPAFGVTIDPFSTLTLDGGMLSTGSLSNNGTFDFLRGTVQITGAAGFNIGSGALGGMVTLGTGANLAVSYATTVNTGAMLRVNGGSFSGSAVTNNGTIDHRDGTLSFSGTLSNNSGGRVFIGGIATPAGNISNSGRITLQNGLGYLGGAGTLTNQGLLTGDGTVARAVSNNAGGSIRAEAGKTLSLTGSFGANAGLISLDGGTLEFAVAISNSSTGFISGRGSLYTAGLTNQGSMAFSGGNADIHGDVTNASGGRIVTSGAGSTTTFFDDVVHNGTEIFTGAGASTVFFGNQSGAGAFTGTGTVYYVGDLQPGNSPATLSYGGDVVLSPSTQLLLEIGGLTRGSQYDSLNIAGTLHAAGSLSLSLINGFNPAFGNVFDLFDATDIEGSFDSLFLPSLGSYLVWDTSELYTTGEIRIGTSLTPIEQWRVTYFGSPANSGAGADGNDFDHDGTPNLLEYALGLDPLVPSTDGLPLPGFVDVGADRHLTLTIVRPLSATDVTYQFEVSYALPTFLPGSSYSAGGDVPVNANTTQVHRDDDGTWETITVRANHPLTAHPGAFLRLKVTNP